MKKRLLSNNPRLPKKPHLLLMKLLRLKKRPLLMKPLPLKKLLRPRKRLLPSNGTGWPVAAMQKADDRVGFFVRRVFASR